MVEKDEIHFFLKDCIKQWRFDLERVIPDNEKKTRIEVILSRAEKLLKDQKLLYQYEITIKTPIKFTDGMMKYMVKNLSHYLTGYGAQINIVESLVADKRDLIKAPEMCKGCKWLRNGECWYNEEYYGTDFPIECSGYEEE